MKMLLSFIVCCGSVLLAHSQSIGIGTTTPHPSAILDVSSNSKGFILPMISQSQRLAIGSPANGLLVYDTTSGRFYQYQDGAWRYIMNSDTWSRSLTRDFTYNTTDSVGIGTSLPQQRLDVNGDILARDIVLASSITAGGNASGQSVVATGNVSANGSAVVTGNLNGSTDMIIDNPSATLQFKESSVNKTFFQLSGNDLRMGTNSGNDNSMFILRMNGANILQVDSSFNLRLLKNSVSDFDIGKMVIGDKIIRKHSTGGNSNSLPILYGRIFSDGTSASMWPPSGSSEKISNGIYEIDTDRTDLSAFGVIVVTATGTNVPRICTARFMGGGKFRVEIFSLAGFHTDNDFYFTITDPLN